MTIEEQLKILNDSIEFIEQLTPDEYKLYLLENGVYISSDSNDEIETIYNFKQ